MSASRSARPAFSPRADGGAVAGVVAEQEQVGVPLAGACDDIDAAGRDVQGKGNVLAGVGAVDGSERAACVRAHQGLAAVDNEFRREQAARKIMGVAALAGVSGVERHWSRRQGRLSLG